MTRCPCARIVPPGDPEGRVFDGKHAGCVKSALVRALESMPRVREAVTDYIRYARTMDELRNAAMEAARLWFMEVREDAGNRAAFRNGPLATWFTRVLGASMPSDPELFKFVYVLPVHRQHLAPRAASKQAQAASVH